MKHNIRINGEVKEIDCELGSGILDKNGREIFEGDKVKFKAGTKIHTGKVFLSTKFHFYFLGVVGKLKVNNASSE